MNKLNSSRLTIARQRRGLNKKSLAEAVGVTRRTISDLEAGDRQPSDETCRRIVEVLRFPHEFFFINQDPPEITADAPSFRALSTMTAAQRNAVLASGALAFEIEKVLSELFELPACAVPDFRDEDPEAAAAALRAQWQLGERPIANMIHLLESKGVRVFSLVEDCHEVDAFAVWHESTPFVFLNTIKSAERGRFDAAHELGHLVLHQHGATVGREAEQQADRFASAFLMPPASVIANAPRLPSVSRIRALKKRWKVSVAALTRRLYDLGLMNQWQYRTACVEISRRGWRKSEPDGAPREVSQLLQKILDAMRDEGMRHAVIAERAHLPPEELNRLFFGKVVYAVSDGETGSVGIKRPPPQLRLVK